MHWELLIIPLIALGVWILGTLFKGEEDRTKGRPRRPSPGQPGRGPVRRPVTDLDRFLEDARRRRETAERRPTIETRQTITPPSSRLPPARPVANLPEALPVRIEDRPAPTSRPVPPLVRTEEQLPLAIPVAQPVVEVIRAMPRPEAPSLPPLSQTAPPPAPSRDDRRLPPIVQQVKVLLARPQTAGAAFVLREIFDRPLCQRRRS